MAGVDAQFQQAMDEFRVRDGIIIDLRGNPGGLAAMLMGISGHFVGERLTLGVMKTRESEFRFVANPRLVSAAGERVQRVCRARGDPDGFDERQCLGMLRRRDAVDRPRAHLRPDVDGPGAARAFRSPAERRCAHPRIRRFRDGERHPARRPGRDPGRDRSRSIAPICWPAAIARWRQRSPGSTSRRAGEERRNVPEFGCLRRLLLRSAVVSARLKEPPTVFLPAITRYSRGS